MSALQSLPENLSLLSPVGFRFLLNNRPHVQYFCQAANVPGISIGTIPHATPLKTYPIGGDEVTFEELSIRFIIDENMKNWREIYDWIITIGIPNETAQEKYRITRLASIIHILRTEYQMNINSIPKSKDGKTIIENAELTSKEYNRKKSDK